MVPRARRDLGPRRLLGGGPGDAAARVLPGRLDLPPDRRVGSRPVRLSAPTTTCPPGPAVRAGTRSNGLRADAAGAALGVGVGGTVVGPPQRPLAVVDDQVSAVLDGEVGAGVAGRAALPQGAPGGVVGGEVAVGLDVEGRAESVGADGRPDGDAVLVQDHMAVVLLEQHGAAVR